jgi:hypothetical protein
LRRPHKLEDRAPRADREMIEPADHLTSAL